MLSEINLSRQQVRTERVQQHQVRNLVTLVTLVVVLWVVYSFSGISLKTLVKNYGHRAETNDDSLSPGAGSLTLLPNQPTRSSQSSPTFQSSIAGEREVQKALRKTLFKYQLHKDEELFNKSYSYIKEYY